METLFLPYFSYMRPGKCPSHFTLLLTGHSFCVLTKMPCSESHYYDSTTHYCSCCGHLWLPKISPFHSLIGLASGCHCNTNSVIILIDFHPNNPFHVLASWFLDLFSTTTLILLSIMYEPYFSHSHTLSL